MAPFVHQLDISDEDQIVEHFQNIPDITEYILESDRYPLAALRETLDTLRGALNNGHLDEGTKEEYHRTMTKIESVISTRLDYVSSMIESLVDDEDEEDFSDFLLEESPTKEILFNIDLMKDVAHTPDINYNEYKTALRKFIKTLKFRFNKALKIHKQLLYLKFEDIAEREDEFSKQLVEEESSFLEDALAMTRSHVPAKPIQIQQLKETLFKILESMGVRTLRAELFQTRALYTVILKKIEDVITGSELDFGQKIVSRFADMLPEYIADNWHFDVVKHNRKLVALFIDNTDDPALLTDLYHALTNLTIAEAALTQRKQETTQTKLKDIQQLGYLQNDENAFLVQMEEFKNFAVPDQARELIKLSIYGLCEYISKLAVDEFRKYPSGIIRSTEKMLKDLEQHRLRASEVRAISNVPEYVQALSIIEESLATYDSSDEKYNFVDIYKESDFTVDGSTYCAFNDIILRLIQNTTEAYFVVDSTKEKISELRLAEMKITIAERYKTEWIRQNELRLESEQKAMEELAEELV